MSARSDRVEVWWAAGSQPNGRIYHWSYIASNGRILADGAQGYSRRIDALRGARRVTGLDLASSPDFLEEIAGEQRQVWVVTR